MLLPGPIGFDYLLAGPLEPGIDSPPPTLLDMSPPPAALDLVVTPLPAPS